MDIFIVDVFVGYKHQPKRPMRTSGMVRSDHEKNPPGVIRPVNFPGS